MGVSIEDFLGLTPEIIHDRVVSILQTIPTRPGTGYIEQRLKEFEAQPWPFLRYLAYNRPDALQRELCEYTKYDGAECEAVIMEKLREQYILSMMLVTAEKYKRDINKDTEPGLLLKK